MQCSPCHLHELESDGHCSGHPISELNYKHVLLTSVLAVLLAISLVADLFSGSSSGLFHSKPHNKSGDFSSTQPNKCYKCLDIRPTASYLSNRTRMRQVVDEISHDMTYVYPIDTVFTTMAKAGTSTTWRMIFTGLTGHVWHKPTCGIIQDKTSRCWQQYLSRVRDLSEDEQWRVLTSNKTFRVAIQREPFSRLISAFKDNLFCSPRRYGTTIAGKRVHILRRQARLPPGASCMNVSEYAEALHLIQRNVGSPDYVPSLFRLDECFRPQNYFANDIFYNLVLDVSDLSNYSRTSPFLDLLPHADLVRNTGSHYLSSGDKPVLMDDKTAQKLHNFALLSDLAPHRYIA